jgi:thiamine biosynthesis lipoprotein
MKNKMFIVIFAIIFLSVFSSDLRAGEVKKIFYQYKYSRPLMGTLVSFTLCAENEAKATTAAEAAFAEIERLESLLSSTNPDSGVFLINKAVATMWTQVSQETMDVIGQSIQLSRDSGGAFDITVGALNRIWKMHTAPKVPSPQEIKATLPLVDFTAVQLDVKNTSSVSLGKVGMEIDLGGIAKGYILEKTYKALRRMGIDNGLIDGGGDVYCWGLKPDGSKWEVGVTNPLSPSSYIAVLRVNNKAIFTSGDYARKFTQGGITYHHIFDPKTGYPANLCRSVTVIGDNISQVNGLSSTVFVLGPAKGLRFLGKYPGVEAIIVSPKGEPIISPGFDAKYPGSLRTTVY